MTPADAGRTLHFSEGAPIRVERLPNGNWTATDMETEQVGEGWSELSAVADLIEQCATEDERPCRQEAHWDHERDLRKHGIGQ